MACPLTLPTSGMQSAPGLMRATFRPVTRYDVAAMQARMDCLEAHIAQLEARIDELVP